VQVALPTEAARRLTETERVADKPTPDGARSILRVVRRYVQNLPATTLRGWTRYLQIVITPITSYPIFVPLLSTLLYSKQFWGSWNARTPCLSHIRTHYPCEKSKGTSSLRTVYGISTHQSEYTRNTSIGKRKQ